MKCADALVLRINSLIPLSFRYLLKGLFLGSLNYRSRLPH